jgi:hypothetical protein
VRSIPLNVELQIGEMPAYADDVVALTAEVRAGDWISNKRLLMRSWHSLTLFHCQITVAFTCQMWRPSCGAGWLRDQFSMNTTASVPSVTPSGYAFGR